MALIADNQPKHNPEDIIMIDDGTGLSVAIPTVIISKEFGDELKAEVMAADKNNESPNNKKKFVVLLVNFEMENPDDRVEYDIWYTSGDAKALEYIIGMKAYNEKLGKNALMTPHIIVRTCVECDDLNIDCRRYSGNLYCSGFSKDLRLTGRDSLSLSVNEMCIYDAYKDIDNADKWWKFMEKTYKCSEYHFNDTCISLALEEAEIEHEKIMKCTRDEGTLLGKEAENWMSSGIPYSPAVVINNRVYRVIFFR